MPGGFGLPYLHVLTQNRRSRSISTMQTVSRILLRQRFDRKSRDGNENHVPDEQPLRAELLSVSQLEHHAKSLAAWHVVESAPGGLDRLLPRLKTNEVVLRRAYELVTVAVQLRR